MARELLNWNIFTLNCTFIEESSSKSWCHIKHRPSIITYHLSWLTNNRVPLDWQPRQVQWARYPWPMCPYIPIAIYFFSIECHVSENRGCAFHFSVWILLCFHVCRIPVIADFHFVERNRLPIKRKILLFKRLNKRVVF